SGGLAPGGEGAVGGQAPERLLLELTDALLGHAELSPDLAQARNRLVGGAEPQLDHAPFGFRQLRQRRLDGALALAVGDLLLDRGRLVGAQLAEGGLA